MTWREDQRRVTITVNGQQKQVIGASFRGVSFFVESEEINGGRRAVVHEFPLRDDPFADDLGRSARGFRVDGYVIGDDYLSQRDALLAALEGVAGPGELVLPSYGVKRAICMKYGCRISRAEGGMATFALDFAETPVQTPVPTEVVDAAEQIAASADTAAVATKAGLVEQYDTEGLPSFALDSAETALVNAAAALEAELGPIITVTQELAEFTGKLALLTARASSLVRTPGVLLDDFRGAITGLVETALAAPGAVMDALFEAYIADFGTTVAATTATRARELENQSALISALRRVIALEAARLAPLAAFTSIDEAIAARDTVAEILDEQAGVAEDAAYPALVDLRSQVLRGVPGGRAFASVLTVTRNVPIPSLLLAYQLYGSVDPELDIIARNRIAHPGFVAGTLKVLSDG